MLRDKATRESRRRVVDFYRILHANFKWTRTPCRRLNMLYRISNRRYTSPNVNGVKFFQHSNISVGRSAKNNACFMPRVVENRSWQVRRLRVSTGAICVCNSRDAKCAMLVNFFKSWLRSQLVEYDFADSYLNLNFFCHIYRMISLRFIQWGYVAVDIRPSV